MSSNWPEPSMDARPLGLAVVGLGYWGPNLLRVLAEDASVAVRWICDRDRRPLLPPAPSAACPAWAGGHVRGAEARGGMGR